MKAKKSTRKFNQKAKKASIKNYKPEILGTSNKTSTNKTTPGTTPKSKSRKPRSKEPKPYKESKQEKLVKDLFNAEEDDSIDSEDDLDQFLKSEVDKKSKNSTKKNQEDSGEEYADYNNVKVKEETISKEADDLMKDIDELKEKDPEFYQFMKENDPEALNFALDSGDEELEENSDSENDSEHEDEEDTEIKDVEKTKDVSNAILLKEEMLDEWEKSLSETNSARALKNVILAFKSAVQSDDDKDQNNVYKYKVRGEGEFHKLMMISMTQVPEAIVHHIPYVADEELEPEKNKANSKKSSKTKQLEKTVIESNKKWKHMKVLVKSYLSSFLQVVQQQSDTTMLCFVLNQSSKINPYFSCFPKLARIFSRELLRLFGTNSSDDSVTVASLLALRRLAASGSPTIVDLALKGVYLTYVRNSNISGIHSLSRIQLMRNCGVELYEIGGKTIYQHAFVYIRQLAIHLRNSMHVKTKESFRAIYNWQFINSLRFWTELLSTYCGDRADENPELCDLLEPLLYPLIQIITGVSRLIPTAKYFPLRTHCHDMLIRLSGATGIFIPVLPSLISILNNPDFTSRRPSQSTLKQIDQSVYIKAPKQYEHTRVYLEAVLDKVIEQIACYLSIHCTSIGFPDLVVPTLVSLKRWRKKVGNKSFAKHNVLFGKLIEKINSNSTIITKERNKPNTITFGPSNFASASLFMASSDPEKMPIRVYANSILKINSIKRSAVISAINSENNED
ncbi:hypothetical protein BB558_001288 [Smittium angustum]|uniref:Nucleolar complex protein 2 homolog n=1 Tax=Smittium angustum TaxID=133377 RepID=A0A2U1JBW0_SMIAN|nr:hypothetical protein BB558_001288 [Smittium angustum]